MKRLLFLIILLLPVIAWAAPPPMGGGGIPQATSCASFIAEGVCCWETGTDKLYCGTGAAAQLVGGSGAANPMSAVGDLIYGGTAGAQTRLAPNTASTRKILEQTGTGTAGQAPTWCAVTGTGDVVLATGPTLVTPTLGVATATSVNKVAITAPATSATITVVDGSTMGNGLTPTSHAASESATAATLWGNQLHLVTGAYTVTLPATTAGMSATFCSTTAAVFSIDLTGSDAWTLAGTALTAANKITSSGAAGECVYFVVTATNVVRTIWTVGVFIDGGS